MPRIFKKRIGEYDMSPCRSMRESVQTIDVALIRDGVRHNSLKDIRVLDTLPSELALVKDTSQLSSKETFSASSANSQQLENIEKFAALHTSTVDEISDETEDSSEINARPGDQDVQDCLNMLHDSTADQEDGQADCWMIGQLEMRSDHEHNSSSSSNGDESEEDAMDSNTDPQVLASLAPRREASRRTEGQLDPCTGFMEDNTAFGHDSEVFTQGLPRHRSKSCDDLFSSPSLSATPIPSAVGHKSEIEGKVFRTFQMASDPGQGAHNNSLGHNDLVSRHLYAASARPASLMCLSEAVGNIAQKQNKIQEVTQLSPIHSDGMADKRKQNVNIRRKGSWLPFFRGKKKENKFKESQHPVPDSSLSDAVCKLCHKQMYSSSSLRCADCLADVSESDCKDQPDHCSKKTNHQVILQDVFLDDPVRFPTTTEDDSLEDKTHSGPEINTMRAQTVAANCSELMPVKQTSVQDPTLTHRSSSLSFGQSSGGKLLMDLISTSTLDSTSDTNLTEINSGSFESLDGALPEVPVEISFHDPDLQLADEESKPWSSTVNTKMFTQGNIKRQDTIWELIESEKQFVKRLKIMQKIFAHLMLHDLKYTESQVNKLFPRLNDLVEVHSKFLHQLLTRQRKDKYVHEIGDVLLDQFCGVAADKMKAVYGVYCSKHTEAVQMYNELVKSDRKFQSFAKYCKNLPVCGKQEISDFIQAVTVRLTKYSIFIEAILKNTEDNKKDRENLIQASLSCKNVVQHVNERVNAYGKLLDIQSKMDSRTVTFKGRKFKRQDLNSNNRELVHAGKIGWMSAQGRVFDVLAVVLTDVLVFLQRNEQSYTFLMQDKKSCVIPLHYLLVREKSDVRRSLGIYVINLNKHAPEMYELVCQSKGERQEWIRILQDAIRLSPADVELKVSSTVKHQSIMSNDVKKYRQIEHANKVKHIIEELHGKDKIIKKCCIEKNALMQELLELSTHHNDIRSHHNSQEIDIQNESVGIVLAAIQEASRLTDILQGKDTQLSWSASDSEEKSGMYTTTKVPKRAETFSGFHSNHDSSKISGINERVGARHEGEPKSPCASWLEQNEKGRSFSDTQDTMLLSKFRDDSYPWKKFIGSQASGDQNSLEEVSTEPVRPLTPEPSSEQVTSMLHLLQHLNIIMNQTSQQGTKVESLTVELAEAKEEIAKLSAGLQSNRAVYNHSQLEKLRNLKESLNQEKLEWETKKIWDQSRLKEEREKLDEEWKELEEEKLNPRIHKEDLEAECEMLQRNTQIRKQDSNVSRSSGDSYRGKPDNDRESHQQRQIAHFKSASADHYDVTSVRDYEDIKTLYSWGATAEL